MDTTTAFHTLDRRPENLFDGRVEPSTTRSTAYCLQCGGWMPRRNLLRHCEQCAATLGIYVAVIVVVVAIMVW